MTARGRPITGSQGLLSRSFDGATMPAVRAAITTLTRQAGLDSDRLHHFVLVVSEILTNAIRHGGGVGHVQLWCVDHHLHCRVTDQGPGIPPELVNVDGPPSADQLSGRGLWLARQLADSLTIATGSTGTSVHAVVSLAETRRPAAV